MKMKKFLSILCSITLIFSVLTGINFTVKAEIPNYTYVGGDIEELSDFDMFFNNYGDENGSYTLQNDIVINSTDSTDYNLEINTTGISVIDLNGHNITVTSDSTRCLFTLNGTSDVRFVNSKNTGGNITLNSKYSATTDAINVVKVASDSASFYNYNCNLILGAEESTQNSSIVSGTGTICILGGKLTNKTQAGYDISVSNGSDVKVSGMAELYSRNINILFYPGASVRLYNCYLKNYQNNSDGARIVYAAGSKKLSDVIDSDARVFVNNVEQSTFYSTNVNDIKKDLMFQTDFCSISGCLTEEVFGFYAGHVNVCTECMSFKGISQHNMVQVKAVEKEPTCTKDGWSREECSICKKTYFPAIKATGHSYTETSKVTPATLSQNGKVVTTYTCKHGDDSYSEVTKTIYAPKTFELSQTAYTYNGKVNKPAVTVKDSQGKTIPQSSYTVSNAGDGKSVGTQKLTITMKGQYSGTKTLTYTINPKAMSLKTVKANNKGFTAKWKKQTAQTTGYQIQYSTSKNFAAAKIVTVKKNKTTTAKVKKLQAKTKYYVRIRTYKTAGGKKYYSAWSKAKKVTTKGAAPKAAKKYVKSLKLSKTEVSIKAGNTAKVNATVKVVGKASKAVSVTSSNPSVATVKAGKTNSKGVTTVTITAKAAGTATVTITVKGKSKNGKGISKTMNVKVTQKQTAVTEQPGASTKPGTSEQPTTPTTPTTPEETTTPVSEVVEWTVTSEKFMGAYSYHNEETGEDEVITKELTRKYVSFAPWPTTNQQIEYVIKNCDDPYVIGALYIVALDNFKYEGLGNYSGEVYKMLNTLMSGAGTVTGTNYQLNNFAKQTICGFGSKQVVAADGSVINVSTFASRAYLKGATPYNDYTPEGGKTDKTKWKIVMDEYVYCGDLENGYITVCPQRYSEEAENPKVQIAHWQGIRIGFRWNKTAQVWLPTDNISLNTPPTGSLVPFNVEKQVLFSSNYMAPVTDQGF